MDGAHVRVHLQPADAGTPPTSMLQDELFTSHALEDKVSGTWTLQLTRKIESHHDIVRGVLVVSLKQSHFNDVYRCAQVGPQGCVLLARLDGVVRARAIEGGTPGGDMLRPDFFTQRLDAQPDGATTSASFDAVPRIIAYSRVGNYPLAVVSSMTQEHTLAT